MFANRELVRKVANRVRAAARETVDDLIATRIQHEPSFTDRFLGHVQHQLDGKTIAGVRWTAKTLTDRVPNSQESEFGADFMAVLDVEMKNFLIKKGFLAQAKRVEPGDSFGGSDSKRLKAQCEKMLFHSPASFVLVYSAQSGVTVVPAVDVLAARDCNPHELTAKSIHDFFVDHLNCFIGDRKIRTADVGQLAVLREEFASRTALALIGRGA